MKYLVLLLVIGIVLWLTVGRQGRTIGSDKSRARRRAEAEPMVECAHCGVHLPRADAVIDGASTFCSEAHRLAGPKRTGR